MHAFVPPPGTVVWIRQRRWRVERAHVDRNVVRLEVVDRERRLIFLAPFDRPATTGQTIRARNVRPQRAIGELSALAARAPRLRAPMSALDAHVDILPHQLEPLLAVLNGARRVLIADEVGLGKTIQAALVMSELGRRREALRALVIVPSSLISQWLRELEHRVGVRGERADRCALAEAARDDRVGANPWWRPGVWVASADYLKQHHVIDAMPVRPWDLVVIDEAHDACGDSERHAACDNLAKRARHVLLLTATPHSGDQERFARLCHLGRLTGMADELTVFRRTRRDLDRPFVRRVRWHRISLSVEERAVLHALAAYERAVLGAVHDAGRSGALLLLSVFRKRALSTMRAFHMSVERRLSWIDKSSVHALDWIQARLDFEDQRDERDDLDRDERTGLMADAGLTPAEERNWLSRLRRLTQAAFRRECKTARLVHMAARTSEAMVVFTQFRDSLVPLERALSRVRRVTVLHGGQSSVERQASLDRFLSSDASVLIGTDVAGQGLNLQSRARWVVSFELPWNPTALEQRIGRVDRIGQTRSVHATIFVARHEAENGLLVRLAARALTARGALGDDDTWDTMPPTEQAVASSLFTGAVPVVEAPAARTVERCQRWRLTGRAVARHLLRRQELGRHWRGPAWNARRLRRATTRRLPYLKAFACPCLAIISVPIVDAGGAIVESHLVAVRATTKDLSREAVLTVVSDAVRRRLSIRIRRLAQMSADVVKMRISVERALIRHLIYIRCPEGVQTGLFDRTAHRRFDVDRREIAALEDDAALRVRSWMRSASLEIGKPRIELIFQQSR